MKAWVLRLHRWMALAFAVPLLVVMVTGLILSFEPWLTTRAIRPGTLAAEKVQALLSAHDPEGKARSLAYRSYDDSLLIGAGRGSGTVIDAATGQVLPGLSAPATMLLTARRMHETLLIEARWLVIGSTAAMLALALLGMLLGMPRIRNTLPGWHKAMAWGLLPLIVASPLTGLLLAWNVGLARPLPPQASQLPPQASQRLPQANPSSPQLGPASPQASAAFREARRASPEATQRPRMTLAEAVRVVGAAHDLSTLVWLRPQGERLLVRLVEEGQYRVYSVTRRGTVPLPANWPRLWHEGNFAGAWSALMNGVLSIAMLGLLGTGSWMWLRRSLRRKRANRARRPQSA